jgi:mannose-6-phosphate isomerase-like protein (cupin superfamily)
MASRAARALVSLQFRHSKIEDIHEGDSAHMRKILTSALLVLSTAALVAQQPAPVAMKTFASQADVAALIAKAKSERKEGQPLLSQPILRLAPYNANLEYRASVGAASLHEKEAEMFYVIQGSATLVTGGKLVNESRTNAENLTGTAIEGGESRPLTQGAFVIVPEGTPHWFSPINETLILMSLHVPRPVPPAK